MSKQLVVLVPGFLGFDQLGGFGYFGRRVHEVLRKSLKDRGDFEVEAVKTDPSGSLASRQRVLLNELERLRGKYHDPPMHIVGHSTGGLDAELLLRARRLDGAPWAREHHDLRRAVRTVVTIASPLNGTSLSLSSAAKFFREDLVTRIGDVASGGFEQSGLIPTLKTLVNAFSLPFFDPAAKMLVRGMLRSPGKASRLVLQVLLERSLVEDLKPQNVQSHLRATEADPEFAEVKRVRYLTVARNDPASDTAGNLFANFEHLLRDAEKDPSVLEAAARGVKERIDTRKIPIIQAIPWTETLDAKSSDGIVNTLRQLLPAEGESLATELDRIEALVLADHADVLGYFPARGDRPCEAPSGFLSSGSVFSSIELRALYSSIAGALDLH